MLKSILACFESELTYLQKKEVELGLRNGLKKEDVRLYASREYNYLQMKEIRLCLEHGVDKKRLKRILHSDLTVAQMYQYRMKLERNEMIPIDMKRYILISLFIISMFLFFTLFPIGEESPTLELKEESITLQCGDTFDPMSYIQSFSSKQGQLILPSSIDTSKQGNHVLVYRLKTKNQEIEKILYVKVK